jgi:hypothetical protein
LLRGVFIPRFIPDKVNRPILDPRVKEWDQYAGLWIERANIGTFISITPKTYPGPVFDISLSTMLPGHNMIGLMGMESIGLWEPAILATIPGTRRHFLAYLFR